jgi:hypothetical protein
MRHWIRGRFVVLTLALSTCTALLTQSARAQTYSVHLQLHWWGGRG